nr:hypothetical protein [Legionella jordanis]
MGKYFETEFLSDALNAQALFMQEKPGSPVLNPLINQLVDAHNFEKLTALLSLVGQGEWLPDKDILKAKILSHLLVDALNCANKEQIKTILQDLDHCLTNQPNQWQELISNLILWIEKHHPNEEIGFLLQHLPAAQRERLYSRLLETADGRPHWLEALITYVLHSRDVGTLIGKSEHLEKLAASLLLSPTCAYEHLNQLSLFVSTEKLVNIIFQLRALAATYAANNQERQHSRFAERRQIYLHKYDVLATALTVRATSSKVDYEHLISDNSELANILFSKRLKEQGNPIQQKELLAEFFEQNDKYDVTDPQLKTTLCFSLLAIAAYLPHSEFTIYFKNYVSIFCKKSSNEDIRFLDDLFDKHFDRTQVFSCLTAIDDEDRTKTINYITYSKSRDNLLTEECFKSLTVSQLINLFGHITALRLIFQQGFESLCDIYYTILCEKMVALSTPEKALSNLAQMIKVFPEEVTREAIQIIFNHFKSHSSLRQKWLMTLLAEQFPKHHLLPHCRELLKVLKLPEQLNVLKHFNSDEFLAFYLEMNRLHVAEAEFQPLVELLKTTDRQPLLLYLLLNTPQFNEAFLDKLMPFIDDKNLITLIEELLKKTQSDSNYSSTLNQLLNYFCQRLQTTMDEKAAIHQWTSCENPQQLISFLLENPSCFFNLCSRSSLMQDYTPSLLQGFVVLSPATDLKLRANRILNLAHCDENNAEAIALRLLGQFHTTPKKLQTLFINLETAQQSLTEQGKKNYLCLKQACWNLLSPKQPFDEKKAFQFLTTQLCSAHCFDPLLARLASDVGGEQDSNLCAQYLVQIDVEALEHMDPSSLARILARSLQENTKANWLKVAIYLQGKENEQTIKLIKHLLCEVRKASNNPGLLNKSLSFILGLANLDAVVPFLSNEELQWLFKECKSDELIKRLPSWLNQLSSVRKFEDVDYGALLSLLPQNPILLETIYQREDLQHHLATIFIIMATNANQMPHSLAIFQHLSKQSSAKKIEFVRLVQQNIQSNQLTITGLLVINLTLLSLSNWQISQSDNINLVLEHLRLIKNLGENHVQAEHLSRFPDELQQMALNLLSYLIAQDNRWAHAVLASPVFAQLALSWLKELRIKSMSRHPLTIILLEHGHINFHPELTNASEYQDFIKQILSSPPIDLNEDQFILFFNQLTEENKKKLAQELLQRPTLGDVQWSSLLTLAQVLPVEDLYEIYSKSKTRFVFVDLLARHPRGLNSLSSTQLNILFTDMTSGKQVLRILDSYSPPIRKKEFIKAIFEYLEKKNISLAHWFDIMNIDAQTLAAFSNYTVEQKHCKQLMQVIDESHYLKQGVIDYLQNPSLDMQVDPEGLLFRLLQQTALHPWRGTPGKPQLIKHLEPSLIRKIVGAQFELWNTVNLLQQFYEPFMSCHEVAPQMLCAARWLQRIPILTEALFEIIREYLRADVAVRETIEGSPLYQQVIKPLFCASNLDSFYDLQFNDMQTMLEDYCRRVESLNSPHQQIIRGYLESYQKQIATIEFFSEPKLIQFFRANSYLARIKNGVIHQLQSQDIDSLANSLQTHNSWLERKGINPSVQFENLLKTVVPQKKIFTHDGFREWFLQVCLFSPLTQSMKSELLQSILAQYPNEELFKQIEQLHRRQKQQQAVYKTLKEYEKISSLSILIKELSSQSFEELKLQLSILSPDQQPYLYHILMMVLKAKSIQLAEVKLQQFLLPPSLGNNFEMDWLRLELIKLADQGRVYRHKLNEITKLAMSFNDDAQDETRIKQLAYCHLKTENTDELASILNSYLPLFSRQKTLLCHEFLMQLQKFYFESEKTQTLIAKLSPTLVKQMMSFAVQDSQANEKLIEDTIRSGFAQDCETIIQQQLHVVLGLKARDDIDKPLLAQLSLEEFAKLSEMECKQILALQRLSFLIKPLPELAAEAYKNKQEFQLFSAEASLYNILLNQRSQMMKRARSDSVVEQAQKNFDVCLKVLFQNNRGFYYYPFMEKLQQDTNIQAPGLYFHWLCLTSFLTEDKEKLIADFINWLQQISEKELSNQIFLERLLTYIVEENLLQKLCQGLALSKGISETKSTWLFNCILQIKTADQALLKNIVLGFSWSWIQAQVKESPENRTLFLQLALQQENHLKAIRENASGKQALFNLLRECQIPINELIKLQKAASDELVRSIIATHLATRKDYIDNFSGEEFFKQISKSETIQSSRLQGIIDQLQIAALEPEFIKGLQAEAAASLLCSVKHFHQLSTHTVNLLLQQVHEQIPGLIKYWLNLASRMPNRELPLLAFIQLHPNLVLAEVAQMPEAKKNQIILSLLQNLDQLPSSTLKMLLALCDEEHLNQICHLYFYGRQASDNAIQFIRNLTNKILENKKPLKSQTIQLLMRMGERDNFLPLQEQIGQATSNYLRSSALFADCSIFYDDGQLNIKRLQKPIHLRTAPTEKPQSYVQIFSRFAKKLFLAADETPEPITDIHVNPLIKILSEELDQITSIDYFLVHYHGKKEPLQLCLSDYFDLIETTGDHKKLQTTAWLLTRAEIAPNTRQILFDELLKRPGLFNESICGSLLEFAPEQAIQQFTLKKDYHGLIQLCTLGLRKLDADSESATIAKRALSEAEFEFSIANISGFLANFRIWLKRSLFYGWQSWFEPREPKYVQPFNAENQQFYQAQIPTETHAPLITSTVKSEQVKKLPGRENLGRILHEVNAESDLISLKILTDALAIYDWQMPNSNELNIRKTVDELFEGLLHRSKSDRAIDNWLPQQLEVFINNRNKLIGLYIKHQEQESLRALLSRAIKGPGNFYHVASLLSESKEPETIEVKACPTPTEPLPSAQASLITRVSGTIYSWSSSFWSLGRLNQNTGPQVSPDPSRRGWFQGILY